MKAISTTQTQSRSIAIVAFLLRYGIFLAFVILCVTLALLNEYFLTPKNLLNIVRQTSINGILALGQTLVVLTRGIDLSVGSTLALAGIVAASMVRGVHAENAALAVAAGLAVGAGVGLVNGLLVARLGVPPFVATLGMLSIGRGLTFIYSNGMPIPNLSQNFLWIGQGDLAGIPIPIFFFLGAFIVLGGILNKTTYGRYIYAVGGNEKSAKTAGIATKAIIVSVYVLCGILAALGGLILTARTTSGLPQAGSSYELDAIAAVVIGGTSLNGGVGTIQGTLIGALIIGVINNGLDLLGVSSFYQQVVKGVIIIIAVLLDSARHARE